MKPGKEKYKKIQKNWTQRDSGGNNHFTFADEKIFTWLYVLQREGGDKFRPHSLFFFSVVLHGTFTYNNQHRSNLEEQKKNIYMSCCHQREGDENINQLLDVDILE